MTVKPNMVFSKRAFFICMALVVFITGIVGSLTVAYAAGELVVVPNVNEQTITVTPNQSAFIAPNIALSNFGYQLSSAKLVIENLPADASTSYTAVSGLTVSYDNEKTVYTITGTADASVYQTLFRSFKITCGDTLQSNITFTFLVSANTTTPMYYAETGHYYEYISAPSISWTDAALAASARTYNGMVGYLVTITSAGENAFVVNKMAESGWIGASDALVNHTWIWATGPEAGTQFWQGLDASNGGYAVNDAYTNWLAGEPNDDNGAEHYAHIFVNSAGWEYATSLWNDMPNVNTFVQGYTVEYGGMPVDDPEDLDETVTIHIETVSDETTEDIEDTEDTEDAEEIEYPQTGDDHHYLVLILIASAALIGIGIMIYITAKQKAK